MYDTIAELHPPVESHRLQWALAGGTAGLLLVLATVISIGSRSPAAPEPYAREDRVQIVATETADDGTAQDTTCTGYRTGSAEVRTSTSCFADPTRIGDRVAVIFDPDQADSDRRAVRPAGRVDGDELILTLVDRPSA